MKPSRIEWVAIICVFVLAGVLRLGYPGVNAFASDEARVSLSALQMARDGQLATVGISSSSGARNFPASIYAFVLPYGLSTDPLVATQWVGAWSLGAVVGVWWLARRAWGAIAALVAALFIATAPFAVFFSRNIWTQNFLVPLATFWLVCAMLALTSRGRWRLFGIGGAVFLGGLAFQIHAAGIVLIPATLWLIARDGWWRQGFVILAGGVMALILLMPFLYEAHCCHPELISEYSQALGQGQRVGSAAALQFTAQIGVNYGWHYLALGDGDTMARVVPLAVVAAALLLSGMAGFTRTAVQNPAPASHKLVELSLVLLSLPIAFFSFQSAPVRLHYLLPTLPALALLAGCAVNLFSHRVWQGMVISAATALALIWSAQIVTSLSILDRQLVTNGMGIPLAVVRDTAHALPKDKPIIVLTQSDDVTTRGEPATWAVLLWDTPHRVVSGWTTLILPHTPTTLFSDVNGMPAWEEIEAAGLAADAYTIQSFEQAPPGNYVTYDAQPLTGYTALEAPIQFSSGLSLVAWRARVISGRLRISTVYRVTAEPPPGTLQQFTHLRTADTLTGAPPATADISLSAQQWQVGDTLIGIADFLQYDAAAEYWLDIGQYDLATGVRSVRVDGGDTLRLGAFTLP